MAILKCKNCGADIEIADHDIIGVCPNCGEAQFLPGVTEPEADIAASDTAGEEAVTVEDAPVEEAAEAAAAEDAPAEEAAEAAFAEDAPAEDASADTVPLLELAVNYLAMNDWDNATLYCDQVLSIQPDNAWAYLGKLMAELNVSKPENLKYLVNPFDENENYRNAIAFADAHLRAELTGYIEHINGRNDTALKDSVYQQALEMMTNAETEDAFREAADLFNSLGQYSDSYERARKCYEMADSIKKDALLTLGKEKMASGTLADYTEALQAFEQIPGWWDADEKAEKCRQQIEKLSAKQDADARKAELIRAKKQQLIKRGTIIRVCVTAAIVLCLVITVLLVVFTPRRRYNAAMDLKEEGKYDEAMVAFETLKGYRDSSDQVTDCKYAYAVGMMNSQQYEQAIPAFEDLGDYKDSAEQILNCRRGIKERDYNRGVALLKENKVIEAYALLAPLGEYKDSLQKVTSIIPRYNTAMMRDPRVGGSLFFGKYHTDANEENGMEDIEWTILEVKDGQVLVVSKYALELSPLHTEQVAVTWENSALRAWLNSDFLKTAFTQSELAQIPTVTVPAHAGPDGSTAPGNDTEDKIFLLSYEEVNTYFASDAARICRATAHSSDKEPSGTDPLADNTPENRWWWLRTPGFYPTSFICVSSDGSVNDFGIGVSRANGGIRPAMWIDLSE